MLEAATAREEQRKADSERAQQKSLADQHLDDMMSGKGKERAEPENAQQFSKGRVGEKVDVALDKERLKAAIAAEKKRKNVADEDEAWNQAKKSKTDVGEEELEAYRLTRASAFDDPMANYRDEE
jgi:pre-mRNA-processing factor SLU7